MAKHVGAKQHHPVLARGQPTWYRGRESIVGQEGNKDIKHLLWLTLLFVGGQKKKRKIAETTLTIR